jgi:predicted NAD/FAD-binding protein
MARIAIIGTGISGLGTAYLLHPHHDITVYEKAPRIGGHTRTVTVDYDGVKIPVDTGFIVFNPKNYPHLTALFRHLEVPTHKSDMSFAATIRDGWLEWGAQDTNTVFGQRRNILRPRFLHLIGDVLRFNRDAQAAAERHPGFSLEELLSHLQLGDWFKRYYLLPMAGAIWSCPPAEMLRFPALSLIRFFVNHHLMSASGQPQWYTVTGGAQEYARRLTAPFAGRIRVNCGAVSVTRGESGVTVRDAQGGCEVYDDVVMASHGDETLTLLQDASAEERAILSCFRYQKNRAVLHRDESFMPRRRRCWASWVYESDGGYHPKITVTYWMNRLQGLDPARPLFVSLNPKREIAKDMVFDEAEFDHPMFDASAIAAQPKVASLQGQRRTWFAGAYLGHGFHEDGLASAVAVAKSFGVDTPWRQSTASQGPEGALQPLALPGRLLPQPA